MRVVPDAGSFTAMIDWWLVLRSSLWILGLAVVLAAVRYYDWFARETGRRRREVFGQSAWPIWVDAGLILVCAGLGLGADPWWERLLWLAFAAWFIWDGFDRARKEGRRRASGQA